MVRCDGCCLVIGVRSLTRFSVVSPRLVLANLLATRLIYRTVSGGPRKVLRLGEPLPAGIHVSCGALRDGDASAPLPKEAEMTDTTALSVGFVCSPEPARVEALEALPVDSLWV